MAINVRQLFPLQQAKLRRSELTRYLRLDGGRYLISAALLLSLMSLISLGQTSRLAAQGYAFSDMQATRTNLLREQGALRLRLSEARSLARIEQRASDLRLRPLTPDQARYLTVTADGIAPITPAGALTTP